MYDPEFEAEQKQVEEDIVESMSGTPFLDPLMGLLELVTEFRDDYGNCFDPVEKERLRQHRLDFKEKLVELRKLLECDDEARTDEDGSRP